MWTSRPDCDAMGTPSRYRTQPKFRGTVSPGVTMPARFSGSAPDNDASSSDLARRRTSRRSPTASGSANCSPEARVRKRPRRTRRALRGGGRRRPARATEAARAPAYRGAGTPPRSDPAARVPRARHRPKFQRLPCRSRRRPGSPLNRIFSDAVGSRVRSACAPLVGCLYPLWWQETEIFSDL